MKYTSKLLSIVAAIFGICASCAFAQDKVGDIARAGDSYFILVRIFDSPEKNNQFQKNFETMRRHSQLIEAFKAAIEKETDAKKKDILTQKLKTLEDDFTSNERKMVDAYSFSAARQYKMVFNKTTVCAPLTREEMGNLTDKHGNKLDASKIRERDGTFLYAVKTVTGEKENEELQRIFWFDVNRKNEISALRTSLAQTTDPAAQMELLQKISTLEKAIKENDVKLQTLYSITPDTQYVLEVENSKLFMQITPEEVAKIQERNQQKAKANK